MSAREARNVAIFGQQDLNPEHEELMGLIKLYPRERVKQTSDLIHEGEPVRSLIYVEDGAALLYSVDSNGHEVGCGGIFPGDILLESVHGGTYSHFARSAATGMTIRRVPLPDLRRALERSNSYGNALLEESLRIKARDRKWFGQVQGASVARKVVSLLFFFEDVLPVKKTDQDGPGVKLSIPFSIEDAAMFVGASREKITKVLSQLRADEIIDYESKTGLHKISIPDIRALKGSIDEEESWSGNE
jgi:CRP-like cAMP-binding protein